MGDLSSVWAVRVRVVAHTVVGLLLGVAVVVTALTSEVTAAAASTAALVFFLQARRAEVALSRAQRTTQHHAVRAAQAHARAEQAQAHAEQVRVHAGDILDSVVTAATQTLPQHQADDLILTVFAYRENLRHAPNPKAPYPGGLPPRRPPAPTRPGAHP